MKVLTFHMYVVRFTVLTFVAGKRRARERYSFTGLSDNLPYFRSKSLKSTVVLAVR